MLSEESFWALESQILEIERYFEGWSQIAWDKSDYQEHSQRGVTGQKAQGGKGTDLTFPSTPRGAAKGLAVTMLFM
jgi:hypothetical protein